MRLLKAGRMTGQAFTESLVAVLFLSPLLLSMSYLVELMRAEQGAVVSARELVLAAVHTPTGHAPPALIEGLHDLSMPADRVVGERLAPRIASIELSNPATDVEKVANGLLLPATLVGVGRFDLPEFLPQRASTGVSLGSTRDIGVPFDLPVVVQANLAFMAGHGAAGSPAEVRSRTAALSVGGALAEVSKPIELLATIASLLEPALRRLCVGRIDPEIVPADRLPDSVTRSSDLRYQPC